jgi:thiamine pyrophosphokinase
VILDLRVLDGKPSGRCFDCLIVLNSFFEGWMLEMMMGRAKHVIASDGGANYLYHSAFRDAPNLHSIVGDLDSLQPSIQEYYRNRKISIIQEHDQDTNDFQEAVALAYSLNFKTVVCLGTLGGRIDQELCNLSVIEMFTRKQQEGLQQRFVALGTTSLMFMLKDGETATIKVGELCDVSKVGIFCFGKSKVDTEGFKWNIVSKESEL